MILTCPTCASRYFVEDSKLGPLGRTVRCASCGASWRAEPEGEPLDLQRSADQLSTAEALPKTFRQQAEAKRRTREAVAAGVVWAGLAASFAVLVLVAVVFRVQVVRLWPRTAGAYAAVRLPVNPLGLAPDDIQAGQGLENGQAALVVTGAERNVETRPRRPAPVRITLYDKAGAPLASRIIRPTPEPIAAGESRAFSVSFLNPPLAGVQVGVDFLFEPAPRRVARPPRAAHAEMAYVAMPRLRGEAELAIRPAQPKAGQPLEPKPKLAQPLAATSPYALPAPASAPTP